MDVGSRIKMLRENAGLTQKELAKVLKIGNSTLSQYESGARVPSDDIKISIVNYFGVSLDYLLGRTDQKEQLPAEDRELKAPEGYEMLTSANRMIVDRLIVDLAKSQSGE